MSVGETLGDTYPVTTKEWDQWVRLTVVTLFESAVMQLSQQKIYNIL